MLFIPEEAKRSTVPGFHLHPPARLLFSEEGRGHFGTNCGGGNYYSGGLPHSPVVFKYLLRVCVLLKTIELDPNKKHKNLYIFNKP